MSRRGKEQRLRLADLLAALSLVTDLGALTDVADPRQVLAFLVSGLPNEAFALDRAGALMGRITGLARHGGDLAKSHCEVATSVAGRLGLPVPVQQALGTRAVLGNCQAATPGPKADLHSPPHLARSGPAAAPR